MLDFLAEKRILEAVSRGELDDLPGAGRPLALDDDPLVAEELRVAHRILKNAGCAPADLPGKRIGLLRLRVEPRYYGRLSAKLASTRTRRPPF